MVIRKGVVAVAVTALVFMAAVGSAAETARPAGGAVQQTWRIQIGAMSARGEAEQEWRRVQRRHGNLLDALSVSIARAELAGGTFFRVQAGPLADRAAAASLCSTLRTRRQACLVVAVAVADGSAAVTGAAAPAIDDDADANVANAPAVVPGIVPAGGDGVGALRLNRLADETIQEYADRLRAMSDREFLRHIGITDDVKVANTSERLTGQLAD